MIWTIVLMNISILIETHKIYGVGSNKFGELGMGSKLKLAKDVEKIPFNTQSLENSKEF